MSLNEEQYYIFNPHDTQNEDPKVKYHIVSDNDIELKTLCGIDTTEKLLNYSCNGDKITLNWYKQNILVTDIVCKKCSKKLLKILEERNTEKETKI